MKAYNLKTNRLTRAMGIDTGVPIFTWLATDGIKQTAFRVKVTVCDAVIHDSGEVYSSDMSYRPELFINSRTRARWAVVLRDENGVWGEESSTEFETTIAKEDWVAKWINPELNEPEYCKYATDGKPLNKASYLKREFVIDKLGAARLYATAHGVYNVYVNGTELEGYYMAPGTSYYVNRLQVQTYDLDGLLHLGKNEITVTLGEGWWRGSTGWSMGRYCYGTDLALLCQLEIDGKAVVFTDENWKASQNGPLMENDTMRLERYDARKVITDWHRVHTENFGYEMLIGTDVPITAHEHFKPTLIITPNGERVLDFGQNFAGYVELDLEACGGESITLTHGEVLSNDGNFQNDNFQNPDSPLCRQVIEYTCRKGRNIYHPTKCYYGFRYVLIESELDLTGEEFTGVALYSDMMQTAEFECGVADVNKLFNNILWSMKSNFVDVPTDCPHREKLGFTGDCQVFSAAALYLMDSYPVLRRWLRESVSCQAEDGCILYVAPPLHGPQPEPTFKDGSAGWSSSMTIVPERFLHYLNSPDEIREFYPAIKKWINYNLKRAIAYRPDNEHLPEHIRNYILDTANNWGEWCEPGRNPKIYAAEGEATGHAEIATAFLAYDALLASEIASRLGEKEDARYFKDVYEKVKTAYRYLYVKNGKISSDRQCHYVRPIAHKLLDGAEIQNAADSLVALIRKGHNKIGTGFLTTCHLCDVLTDNGYPSVAYDLLLQREQPSWLFEVEKGATTTWESWLALREGNEPRSSFNHYSLGAVASWMMGKILGISVRDGKIIIQPYTDSRLGYAKGSFISPYGMISSSWKYEQEKIIFTFEVPSNSEATVILQNGLKETVKAGVHSYTIPI